MQYGRHLVEPGHSYGIAADVYEHYVFIDSRNGFDHLVLSVRQFVCQAINTLAVLVSFFVESANEDDDIGFFSRLYGFCAHFFSRTMIFQLSANDHAVLLGSARAYVSAHPFHVSFFSCTHADALQRRDFVERLEGG